MYKKLLPFLIIALIFSALLPLAAQQDIKNEQIKKKFMKDHLQFNSSQGKDFWFAIPPNECDGQPVGNTDEIAIAIYVTASKNTLAKLEVPNQSFIKTKLVESFKITTFSSINGDASFNWECRVSDKVTDLGIHVSADEPLSVYVLNNRNVTSDGYLAIPASSCGIDYIHLCYYDFWEVDYPCQTVGRGSGFIIVPTLDNTEAIVTLKGRGKDYSQTVGGKKIGETFKVMLDRGQTYMIMGEGKTRGTFDISGSRIRSNKPIGLISFHTRTLLPSNDLWNGRDNMMEMIPPVSAWGKKYTTVEYKRNGYGDFFRIIAAEDNTKFSVRWYDLANGQLIGRRDQTLRYSGDFAEYEEAYVPRNTVNTIQSIRGTSVWEADKPVLVVQYSYSADWDNDTQFDPFSILVVPEEQFVQNTVFQTPDKGSDFITNWFNIVAVGDTLDDNQDLLRTIKLDNRPIWADVPGFILNNIPTTNLYWAKIAVEPGAHVITSDTRFGGYIYGFSEHNSYGWPAAMAIKNLEVTDTLPPQLYITGLCGSYEIDATELRNGGEKDNPRQVDQGVNSVTLLHNFSSNYNDPVIISPSPFEPYPPVYQVKFSLDLIDKYMDGKAVFVVDDRVGNISVDSLFYEADSLTITPNPVDFGKLRYGQTKKMPVDMLSGSDSVITIKSIRLQTGAAYEITKGAVTSSNPLKLASRAIHELELEYTPQKTANSPDDFEIDTIIVETQCLVHKFPVKGMAAIPKITVKDFDAGTLILGKKKCISEIAEGLEISNPGSDTLVITAIKNVQPPFTITNPTVPPLPLRIPPGETIYLREICFEPDEIGDWNFDIVFDNNAEGPDSISKWTGNTVTPGPNISGWNWNERRVKTVHQAEVYIKNTGTTPIIVTGVKLDNQTENNFKIIQSGITPSLDNPVTLHQRGSAHPDTVITVPVEFDPQSEFAKEIKIIAEFDPSFGIPEGSVYNYLRGFGILPKITAEGYEFKPSILINTTHPDIGKVVITNPSKTSETHIYDVKIATASPNPNDFEWVTTLPVNAKIAKEGTMTLDVQFKPTAIGRRSVLVDINSDAVPGPAEPFRTTNQVEVFGNAYDQGVETGPYDFKDVLLCNKPEATIPITNTGESSPVTVHDVKLISGDVDVFEIISFPTSVPPKTTLYIPVRFKPVVRGVGTYEAVVEIKTDVEDLTTTLKGVGYDVGVKLSQRNIESAPGALTLNMPPTYPFDDFPVYIESNNWNDADVTEFEFEMVYRTSWMAYNNSFTNGPVINSWNVTCEEVIIDNEFTKLVVKGKGTNRISENGILLKPVFQLLLSDSSRKFTPTFGNITFKDRDDCIVPTWEPGTVTLNSCVLDLRNIIVSKTQYSLQEIEKNPVSDGSFTIKFGVGLTGSTRVEIINSTGDIVNVICDGVKQSGEYEYDISTRDFSSGIYYVRMTSGEFNKVNKLIIAK